MKIIIETIPHSEQRYPTCGDWFWNTNQTELTIRVSELGDWKKEALIAVHELVECLICKAQDVCQLEVDTFDFEFEKKRSQGDLSEPGDDPKSPYKRQHCFATGIERLLASQLEVDWKEYEKQVEAL